MNTERFSENWSYLDNQRMFYNESSIVAILQNYAELGGLSNCIDIASFYNEIKRTTSLLDVGAGYGRIEQYLLKKKYPGSIETIEVSEVLSRKLDKLSPKVSNHQNDILTYETDTTYQVILSMWSGISDFSKPEQYLFMKKLATLLQEKGIIYLETSVSDLVPLNAKESSAQYYLISNGDYIVRGYIPSYEDMLAYCQDTGLTIKNYYTYKTDVGRTRIIYVIKKFMIK